MIFLAFLACLFRACLKRHASKSIQNNFQIFIFCDQGHVSILQVLRFGGVGGPEKFQGMGAGMFQLCKFSDNLSPFICTYPRLQAFSDGRGIRTANVSPSVGAEVHAIAHCAIAALAGGLSPFISTDPRAQAFSDSRWTRIANVAPSVGAEVLALAH